MYKNGTSTQRPTAWYELKNLKIERQQNKNAKAMAQLRSTEYRDGLPTGDAGHLEALKVEQAEAGGLDCVLRVTGRERRETGSEVKELYLVWKKPEYVFHTKRGSQEDDRSSRQRNGVGGGACRKEGEDGIKMGGAAERGPLGSLLPHFSVHRKVHWVTGWRKKQPVKCPSPSVPFLSFLPTYFCVCGSSA